MKLTIGLAELNVTPDDENYFSEATARYAFFDDAAGTIVVKDCRGNYATSEEVFESEEAFKKLARN